MILIDSFGHMVSSDSEDELHTFAHRIGLKRQWYQDNHHPHYDLTTIRMRHKAMNMGAGDVSIRELINLAWWNLSLKIPITAYFCACSEADNPGVMKLIDGMWCVSGPVCNKCTEEMEKTWKSGELRRIRDR